MAGVAAVVTRVEHDWLGGAVQRELAADTEGVSARDLDGLRAKRHLGKFRGVQPVLAAQHFEKARWRVVGVDRARVDRHVDTRIGDSSGVEVELRIDLRESAGVRGK